MSLISAMRNDIQSSSGGPTSIGVLFGTHNWQSCNMIIDHLVKQGLGVTSPSGDVVVSDGVAERLAFGQLLGGCSLPVGIAI
jgi:proline dehydrogenase